MLEFSSPRRFLLHWRNRTKTVWHRVGRLIVTKTSFFYRLAKLDISQPHKSQTELDRDASGWMPVSLVDHLWTSFLQRYIPRLKMKLGLFLIPCVHTPPTLQRIPVAGQLIESLQINQIRFPAAPLQQIFNAQFRT